MVDGIREPRDEYANVRRVAACNRCHPQVSDHIPGAEEQFQEVTCLVSKTSHC
jgi:hypothetical protein